MRLQVLGSGGFVPTDRRETACALLRRESEALLIDAGTGTRRLRFDPDLLADIERLHVVLTHFHLDHTVGLFYLAGLGVPVEIWGGGAVLEGVPTVDLVRTLLGSPFAPPSFVDEYPTVHELPAGKSRVGGFEVRTRVQPRHANKTLALRVEDALVWCTDTAYDEENRAFAEGTEVLCHEAFHREDETDPGHTAAAGAARLAAAAGVARLLLIHVNPELGDDGELLAFARPHFAASEVATDGLVVELEGGA